MNRQTDCLINTSLRTKNEEEAMNWLQITKTMETTKSMAIKDGVTTYFNVRRRG